MSEKFIPQGYHSLTPYLIVDNGVQAIEFYTKALGAKEIFRLEMGDEKIGHAEIQVGDSRFMLADEFPDRKIFGPKSLGGTSVSLMLYVEDVDTFTMTAVQEGMKIRLPVQDQFYGDRSGTFEDPFGHVWTIGTNQKTLSVEEMKNEMKKN